jgi:hypothetical protein
MRAGRIGDWAVMMGVGFSCRRCIRRDGTFLIMFVIGWLLNLLKNFIFYMVYI